MSASLPRVWLLDTPGSGAPPYQTLQAYAAALQKGLDGDFAKAYGRSAIFSYGDTKDVSPGDLALDLVATMDQPGALGDHTPDGSGRISPILDGQDGAALSQTIDHELKEMLEDLLCDVIRQSSDGRMWANESCDATENDPGLVIDGVTLSNFVWPSWYSGTGSKYDQLGTLKAPLTVSPGGYCQFLSPDGWQQIQSSERAPRSYRLLPSSRTARRAAKWLAMRGGAL
jgi:hypothetical protein